MVWINQKKIFFLLFLWFSTKAVLASSGVENFLTTYRDKQSHWGFQTNMLFGQEKQGGIQLFHSTPLSDSSESFLGLTVTDRGQLIDIGAKWNKNHTILAFLIRKGLTDNTTQLIASSTYKKHNSALTGRVLYSEGWGSQSTIESLSGEIARGKFLQMLTISTTQIGKNLEGTERDSAEDFFEASDDLLTSFSRFLVKNANTTCQYQVVLDDRNQSGFTPSIEFGWVNFYHLSEKSEGLYLLPKLSYTINFLMNLSLTTTVFSELIDQSYDGVAKLEIGLGMNINYYY